MDKRVFVILYEKQKGKCAYCGCSLLEEAKAGISCHLDHIKPGSKSTDNFCLTCAWCNRVKKDRSVKEFMDYIKPYLEGKVGKYELSAYKKYKELKIKFGQIK